MRELSTFAWLAVTALGTMPLKAQETAPSDTVLTGCYDDRGRMYVLSSSDKHCSGQDVRFDFPRGPTGPTGPSGSQLHIASTCPDGSALVGFVNGALECQSLADGSVTQVDAADAEPVTFPGWRDDLLTCMDNEGWLSLLDLRSGQPECRGGGVLLGGLESGPVGPPGPPAIAFASFSCPEGSSVTGIDNGMAVCEGPGGVSEVAITVESTAQTTQPSSDLSGQLHACRQNDGSIYRIREPGLRNQCRSDDIDFSFDFLGAKGPPGPAGSALGSWTSRCPADELLVGLNAGSLRCRAESEEALVGPVGGADNVTDVEPTPVPDDSSQVTDIDLRINFVGIEKVQHQACPYTDYTSPCDETRLYFSVHNLGANDAAIGTVQFGSDTPIGGRRWEGYFRFGYDDLGFGTNIFAVRLHGPPGYTMPDGDYGGIIDFVTDDCPANNSVCSEYTGYAESDESNNEVFVELRDGNVIDN